ncbi:MAG: 4Fe-4S dicluster domain-containing protein [Bacillota bacterium]|jgi:epoxyqueuosine reductase
MAKPNHELKEQIRGFCLEQRADIIGFAPVERWDEAGEVPPDFRPRSLWAPTSTVIVLGIAIPLPIVETTPSILHMETYSTCNRELDSLAFNLVRYLNRLGHASYFFTRDGFGSVKILKKKCLAAFSHVMAAKYAGLGTIGLSHNLLTPQFGPRVRFVSIFTTASLSGDSIIDKELCINCKMCVKCCPKQALTFREGKALADYDKIACTEMSEELTRRRCYPCGVCIKVCPIGHDRKLYDRPGILKKYLAEAEALAHNPDDPNYRSWTHVRKYGSWQENEMKKE